MYIEKKRVFFMYRVFKNTNKRFDNFVLAKLILIFDRRCTIHFSGSKTN